MLTLQNYVGNVQRNLCRSSLSSALLQMANLQSSLSGCHDPIHGGMSWWGRLQPANPSETRIAAAGVPSGSGARLARGQCCAASQPAGDQCTRVLRGRTRVAAATRGISPLGKPAMPVTWPKPLPPAISGLTTSSVHELTRYVRKTVAVRDTRFSGCDGRLFSPSYCEGNEPGR